MIVRQPNCIGWLSRIMLHGYLILPFRSVAAPAFFPLLPLSSIVHPCILLGGIAPLLPCVHDHCYVFLVTITYNLWVDSFVWGYRHTYWLIVGNKLFAILAPVLLCRHPEISPTVPMSLMLQEMRVLKPTCQWGGGQNVVTLVLKRKDKKGIRAGLACLFLYYTYTTLSPCKSLHLKGLEIQP